MIHSDGWRGYAGLVDIGYDKHDCIHHSHNEFACDDKHINTELRAFGVMPAKFNGVSNKTFYLHFKETEFRFNHRYGNLYLEIAKILRN